MDVSGRVNAGLYVHVPFCVHKCGYCDFNSWAETRRAPQEVWLEALTRQILFWSKRLEDAPIEFSTVFWGGGTPSLLENDLFVKASKLLSEHFCVLSSVEHTVECNPETLSADKLKVFQEAGVNRLSMGVQSFDDSQLTRLERHARRKDNLKALELVSENWPGRWSLDLMFGLPDQTMEQWRQQMELACQFEPKHISAYQLTLSTARSQNWQQPPEEVLLAMFDETENFLAARGITKYEVSNFAAPGYESRHNLGYWNLRPFLGLGPGAAGLLSPSFLKEVSGAHLRWGAHQRNAEKFETWAKGAGDEHYELSSTLTARTGKDHLFELLMMGLRLSSGFNASRLRGLIGDPAAIITKAQLNDFIENNTTQIKLNPRGARILDSLLPKIFESFEKNAAHNLDSAVFDTTFA